MKIFNRVTLLLVLVATSVQPQHEDPDGDDRIDWGGGNEDLALNATLESKATPGQNHHVLGVNYTGPGLGGAGIIAVVLGVLLLLLLIGIAAVFTTCGSNLVSVLRWAFGRCLAPTDLDPETPTGTGNDVLPEQPTAKEIKETKSEDDGGENDEKDEKPNETGTRRGRPLAELFSRLPQPIQDLVDAFKRPDEDRE